MKTKVKELIEDIYDVITKIAVVLILTFTVYAGYIGLSYITVEREADFDLTDKGYLIVNGDTTDYKLEKIEAWKLVKEEK